MARIEDARADVFCATHGGVIGSFAALSAKIKDPTEMVPLLKQRDDHNYVDTLKTAAWTVPAALAAFPLAALVAPAVGGAIGVGVLGLEGAAKDPALICIDGFLTEGTDETTDWLTGLGSAYEGHAVYRVPMGAEDSPQFVLVRI